MKERRRKGSSFTYQQLKPFLLLRGVIDNLVSLVGSLGYVPNGGRRYYNRSQPPLLSAMVREYWTQATLFTNTTL